MISTPEGKFIENELYRLLTPYLQYRGIPNAHTGIISEKLTNELLKTASDPNGTCEKNNSFVALNNLLDQININTTVTKKAFIFEHKESILDFEELKKSLKEYKDIQDQMTDQLKAMNVGNLSKIVAMDARNSYTWAELLNGDWDNLAEASQLHLQNDTNLSAQDRLQYETNVTVFRKASAEKRRIIQENPTLIEYKNVVANFDQNQQTTMNLASKVAGFEKKLYAGLYKKYAQENNTTNPCRDFIL